MVKACPPEVMKLGKLANLCWEGLTLKHVSHPKIVLPYLLFVFTAFLFEVFLIVLFSVSCFLFYHFGFRPNFIYFVTSVILICMLVMTFLMLKTTISTHKNVFLKESNH